jgi:hypothetical protein
MRSFTLPYSHARLSISIQYDGTHERVNLFKEINLFKENVLSFIVALTMCCLERISS